MLVDQNASTLVSTMGWVDRNALRIFDLASGASRAIEFEGTRILTLHPGANDHFALVHHGLTGGTRLSVHAITQPEGPRADLTIDGNAASFSGDNTAWRHVPGAYLAQHELAGRRDYALFRIDPAGPSATVQRLGWYAEAYDRTQHGLVGLVEVPGTDLLLIAIQRALELVLYDPAADTLVQKVDLAGQRGNPLLALRPGTDELWATDYDHLLRIDAGTWTVRDEQRLQDAPNQRAMFIGEFAFDRAGTTCAVARPFSGDVAGIDPVAFRMTRRAATGGQPWDVALLEDGRVFARDWQSGALLQATLEPLPT